MNLKNAAKWLVGLGASIAAAVGLLSSSNGPLKITTTVLNLGITGKPYSSPLTATGGKAPYTWSGVNLPAGLKVSSGSLSGTVANLTQTTVTITVKDRFGKTATTLLPLAICAPLVVLNPPKNLAPGATWQFQASGGPLTKNPPTCAPVAL